MHNLEISSREMRRKRTHSLVQLGSLLGQSGLLETFGVVLGKDLQRDPEMKREISSLFNGLVMLNQMVVEGEIFHKDAWAQQGLQKLEELKRKNSKPQSDTCLYDRLS